MGGEKVSVFFLNFYYFAIGVEGCGDGDEKELPK
jgi:hypothetical protein